MKYIKKFICKETILFFLLINIGFITWGACLLCLDMGGGLSSPNNVIANLVRWMKIPTYNISVPTYVQLSILIVGLYLTFIIGGIYFIYKLKNEEKIHYIYYIVVGSCFLFFTFTPIILCCFRNIDTNTIMKEYTIIASSSFLVSLILDFFLILGLIFIYFAIYLIIAIINSNKNIVNSDGSITTIKEKEEENNKEIFVGLKRIDSYKIKNEIIVDDKITLNELANKFRNYLATKQKLFFDIEVIRAFLASFGASRLIILEGLSGTGKSSLPRYFANFIKEDAFFAPVQATWRDRSNLIGYYNDFSKNFKETDFLVRLYEASYKPSHMNIMVLDELNLSRIEYYFADFLSILEYPSSDWKLTLIQKPSNYKEPKHLSNCVLTIPENTWFVGTANKDDSTYLITDKVYDRALVLDFEDRNEPFDVKEVQEPINLSFEGFTKLLNEAKDTEAYKYNKNDDLKFRNIINFVYDTFNITFGNRIMNQIDDFVPCYVSLGGTKEEALDLMFAKKILRKLEGRYEEYVFTGLTKLLNLIEKTYGKDSFLITKNSINNLLRKIR